MRCHYEVLELGQDADDGEIKAAYRRLALKLHPDKNPDNPTVAKEQFQVVQQAYEVLSDRQERAWYDAHRDQILHRADSQFEAQSLDLFQYFTTTCFKGFGNDPQGFYAVYRTVFEQIAKEDIDFMEGKEEFCEIPGFGGADSDYDAVKVFYDYWMSYSTKKSYSWLDPYDVREGKGYRRVVKLIDKENKKARLKARKERNEEVRNLVGFVRKRDKRVHAYQKEMEARVLENRKKQQELSLKKKLERTQMHANEKQAEWLKFDNVQSELEAIEKQLAEQFGENLSQSAAGEENEEGEEFNSLYCIACNKVFKNPKAFENHESSKKHKDCVSRLRETLLQEDLKYSLRDDLLKSNDHEEHEDVLSEASQQTISDCDEDEKQTKKNKKKRKPVIAPEETHSSPVDIGKVSDEEFCFDTKKKPKKKSKKVRLNKLEAEQPEPCEEARKSLPVRKTRKKEQEPIDSSDFDLSHCCITCKGSFPSKNKLFDHLKSTNHGVYFSSKSKPLGKRASVKN